MLLYIMMSSERYECNIKNDEKILSMKKRLSSIIGSVQNLYLCNRIDFLFKIR